MLLSTNPLVILDMLYSRRDESTSCLSERGSFVSRIYWWRWHIFWV